MTLSDNERDAVGQLTMAIEKRVIDLSKSNDDYMRLMQAEIESQQQKYMQIASGQTPQLGSKSLKEYNIATPAASPPKESTSSRSDKKPVDTTSQKSITNGVKIASNDSDVLTLTNDGTYINTHGYVFVPLQLTSTEIESVIEEMHIAMSNFSQIDRLIAIFQKHQQLEDIEKIKRLTMIKHTINAQLSVIDNSVYLVSPKTLDGMNMTLNQCVRKADILEGKLALSMSSSKESNLVPVATSEANVDGTVSEMGQPSEFPTLSRQTSVPMMVPTATTTSADSMNNSSVGFNPNSMSSPQIRNQTMSSFMNIPQQIVGNDANLMVPYGSNTNRILELRNTFQAIHAKLIELQEARQLHSRSPNSQQIVVQLSKDMQFLESKRVQIAQEYRILMQQEEMRQAAMRQQATSVVTQGQQMNNLSTTPQMQFANVPSDAAMVQQEVAKLLNYQMHLHNEIQQMQQMLNMQMQLNFFPQQRATIQKQMMGKQQQLHAVQVRLNQVNRVIQVGADMQGSSESVKALPVSKQVKKAAKKQSRKNSAASSTTASVQPRENGKGLQRKRNVSQTSLNSEFASQHGGSPFMSADQLSVTNDDKSPVQMNKDTPPAFVAMDPVHSNVAGKPVHQPFGPSIQNAFTGVKESRAPIATPKQTVPKFEEDSLEEFLNFDYDPQTEDVKKSDNRPSEHASMPTESSRIPTPISLKRRNEETGDKNAKKHHSDISHSIPQLDAEIAVMQQMNIPVQIVDDCDTHVKLNCSFPRVASNILIQLPSRKSYESDEMTFDDFFGDSWSFELVEPNTGLEEKLQIVRDKIAVMSAQLKLLEIVRIIMYHLTN